MRKGNLFRVAGFLTSRGLTLWERGQKIHLSQSQDVLNTYQAMWQTLHTMVINADKVLPAGSPQCDERCQQVDNNLIVIYYWGSIRYFGGF